MDRLSAIRHWRAFKRSMINAVGTIALGFVVVALYWSIGYLPPDANENLRLGLVALYFVSILVFTGWTSYAFYALFRSGLLRIFGFMALFVWGCVLYTSHPLPHDFAVRGRGQRLRIHLEAINRCYSAFFPSRGDFENMDDGAGQLYYHLFHVSVVYYFSMLMFSFFGRGAVNRARAWLTRSRNLNVFWGMTAPGIQLAKDVVSTTADGQAVFYLQEDLYRDSTEKARLTTRLDKADCIWVFGDFDDERNLSFRGDRHFFLSESGHENVAQANRLVELLRERKRGVRPTFYIRIESSASEQVYLDWVESVKSIVTPVILRETSLIAQQFAREHSALSLPGISVDSESRIVSGCFSNLLLGFGGVGEAVLNSMICNSQYKGTTFKTDVVALNKEGMERYRRLHEEAVSSYGLSFHDMDVMGSAFGTWIKDRLPTYNRIVICLSTDDLNIKAAMHLVRVAKDAGFALDRSSVFIKITNPDIYKYCSSNGDLNERNFFGNPEKLYTLRMLNQDPIDAIAKVLNAEWAGVTGRQEIQRVWDESTYEAQQSSRASALGELNHLNVLGYTMEGQAHAEEDCDEDEVRRQIERHLLLISENEHLRWNAYHRTLGYSTWDMVHPPIESMPSKKANQLKTLRRHAAIVDFDSLPDVDMKLAVTQNPDNAKRFTREDFIGNVKNDIAGDGKRMTPSMQAYDMMFCQKIVDNAKTAGVGGFRRFAHA